MQTENKKTLAPLPESDQRRQIRIANAKEVRRELAGQFNEKLFAFLSTALGVVAALFWQTAILDTIKVFIPVGGTWVYELLVALIFTLLAVLVLVILHRQPAKLSPTLETGLTPIEKQRPG